MPADRQGPFRRAGRPGRCLAVNVLMLHKVQRLLDKAEATEFDAAAAALTARAQPLTAR